MTTHDDFLKSYLAEQDVACPSCGYNLRGLTIRACPECNEALQLRVGLAEPKMKLWLATVLGLAFGVGFSLLVTILLLYAMWVDDPVREDIPIVTCSGSSLLIEGSLLGLLLWRGAWCRRLSVKRRAALCVVAWLLTVTSLVVFISLTE